MLSIFELRTKKGCFWAISGILPKKSDILYLKSPKQKAPCFRTGLFLCQRLVAFVDRLEVQRVKNRPPLIPSDHQLIGNMLYPAEKGVFAYAGSVTAFGCRYAVIRKQGCLNE